MTEKKPSEKTSDSAKVEASKGSETQGLSASINLTADKSQASQSSAKSEKSAEPATSTHEPPVSQTEEAKKVSPTKAASKSTSNSSPKPKENMSKTTASTKPSDKPAKQTLSKTAVLALFLALLGCAGVGGLFYWHQQQQLAFEEKLLNDTQQVNLASQQQLQQLLTQQQKSLTQQLAEQNEQLVEQNAQNLSASDQRIAQLENSLARLSQNEPTDWLLHEAEYLVRIAGRSLWLEHDTAAAINLLHDADARLSELNNPELLPIRQLIHQDIEQLKLMPVLDTEGVILKIMALGKQVDILTMAMVDIPEGEQSTENVAISDNTDDWQANLKITWDRFLEDFITVRRRTGEVEPLMSPQHQQNLRENLKLKLQVAQWAASEQKTDLYIAALDDVAQWVNDYFDSSDLSNQNFLEAVDAVKAERISFEYPNRLGSLKALRQLMQQQNQPKVALPLEQEPVIEAEQSQVTESDEGVL